MPIGRTGEQQYLARDLGLDGDPNRVVYALREPDEVFSERTIASFEGKPVTDDHPLGLLDTNNINNYVKGLSKTSAAA